MSLANILSLYVLCFTYNLIVAIHLEPLHLSLSVVLGFYVLSIVIVNAFLMSLSLNFIPSIRQERYALKKKKTNKYLDSTDNSHILRTLPSIPITHTRKLHYVCINSYSPRRKIPQTLCSYFFTFIFVYNPHLIWLAFVYTYSFCMYRRTLNDQFIKLFSACSRQP